MFGVSAGSQTTIHPNFEVTSRDGKIQRLETVLPDN